jgi:hypothetical protein
VNGRERIRPARTSTTSSISLMCGSNTRNRMGGGITRTSRSSPTHIGGSRRECVRAQASPVKPRVWRPPLRQVRRAVVADAIPRRRRSYGDDQLSRVEPRLDSGARAACAGRHGTAASPGGRRNSWCS